LFGGVGSVWSGRVEVSDSGEAVLREEDGSVSVGFEIDSNVEMSCCVMKVLDTGGDAADLDSSLAISDMSREAYHVRRGWTDVSEVLARTAIGIGSLNNTDLDLVILLHLQSLYQIPEKHGNQNRNLVSIQ
jgi:hypothetical protein